MSCVWINVTHTDPCHMQIAQQQPETERERAKLTWVCGRRINAGGTDLATDAKSEMRMRMILRGATAKKGVRAPARDNKRRPSFCRCCHRLGERAKTLTDACGCQATRKTSSMSAWTRRPKRLVPAVTHALAPVLHSRALRLVISVFRR